MRWRSGLNPTCRPLRYHKLRRLFRQSPGEVAESPEAVTRRKELSPVDWLYKPQGFARSCLRQGLRHSCRKLFAQKNFRPLKGAKSANRYVSCPPGNWRVYVARTRGVRQPVRFFGSRIGSTDLAQYYRVDAVFKPANLGCSFPISTLLALPLTAAPPCLVGRNASLRMDSDSFSALDKESFGNARKIAIQLVKEMLLDETETGSWSAHA
jgi:hypothetical protein